MGTGVAIALGSNLGDRLGTMRAAVRLLGPVVRGLTASPVYETDPRIVERQPRFLNAVVAGTVEIGPFALLERLREIERRLGRVPRERYGPREIDLDLLAYGSLRLVSERLTLPHPALADRRFVLAPWSDLEPERPVPLEGGPWTVLELLARTSDPPDSVQRLEGVRLTD
ncbi:MAG: 2-amino-4-hydroxy-6-hydroxymethyldihydropteridine diphosphokinase [Fimbriimonadales bacterium]|nr:2-amino-4-hydroxy-6-hydroxymethyldihydropteridine diphosphokinase [Fimbriimonadales bacterium]